MEHAGGDGSGDGDGDRRGQNRGCGRGGWSPSQQHPQEHLRRPRNPHIGNQQGDGYYEVTSSSLSADAPEFVPRGFPANPPPPQNRERRSLADRIAQARNEPIQHQPENSMPYYNSHRGQFNQYGRYQQQQQQMSYQPQQYGDSNADGQGGAPYEGGYDNYNRHQVNGSGGGNTENNPAGRFSSAMRQLENAMETLNRSPGQFDDLVVPLVNSLTPHLTSTSHTQDIVNAILEQSISEGNFRYSGARLCSHLDTVETPVSNKPTIFRVALFTKCRELTTNEMQRWPKDPNEKNCNGLMLCLAELVAQLDQPATSILGKLLLQLITVTLKTPAPNSAKFICQVLKLAGQYLERDSTTNRDEIERVMHDLTELVAQGRVDHHVGRMVNSVVELRSANWGRVVSSHGPTPGEPSPAINDQPLPHHSFDEPVLYGPDGTILTDEETSFCQSRADVDAVCDDLRKLQNEFGEETQSYEDDEDDVIAAAYEEFLKLTPNKSGSGVVDRG